MDDYLPDDFNYPRDFAAKAPDELAVSIGRLAIVWSRLEMITNMVCVALLQGKAGNAFMLVGAIGNRTVIDYLHTFADSKIERNPQFEEDLRTLASELNRLLALRNRIVHGQWDPDSSAEPYINNVMRFKGRVRTYDEAWHMSDIDKISAECAEPSCAFLHFVNLYKVDLPLRRYMRQTSQHTFDQPSPAVIQARDPKMTALARCALE